MKPVITDNLSFTDYYHGNSQWQCFIANQNQECHCTCQWWQVSMKCPPGIKVCSLISSFKDVSATLKTNIHDGRVCSAETSNAILIPILRFPRSMFPRMQIGQLQRASPQLSLPAITSLIDFIVNIAIKIDGQMSNLSTSLHPLFLAPTAM